MSERADQLIRAKLQEGGFRTISKPSDLGSDAIGHNAYGLPGKSVSQLARERAAAKQRPKRGLGGLARGDRVHHELRGRGTVHYTGTAPGMRGRPMASILWDNPVQQAAGPEPVFHGSGLAKGLRKLKESEQPRDGYKPQTDDQRRAVVAHIGAFEKHLETLVGGRHVMAAASGSAGHPWLPHAHMTVGQDPVQSATNYHASTKPFWDRAKIKGDKLKAKWDREDSRRDRTAARR